MAEEAEPEVIDPQDEPVEEPKPLAGPEDIARLMGWSDKDNWKGDPEDWKPADAFLKDTVAVNRSLRKEQRQLRDTVDRIAKTSDRVLADTRKRMERELEDRIAAATEAGDAESAVEAARELAGVKDEPKGSAADEFARQNPWFAEDAVARGIAIGAAEKAARQGKSEREQLEAAEAEVKRRMPELFDSEPAPKPNGARPAPKVEGGQRAAAPRPRQDFASMPAEAQAAWKSFEKHGVSKEAFAANYWQENA